MEPAYLDMRHRMEVEEGEALEEHDGTNHLDSIAQKIAELLGDAQKEFEGGVYTDRLGSKFGGYGSFLPTELRPPSVLVLAQAKPGAAPPIAFNPKGKVSPAHVGEIGRLEACASVADVNDGGRNVTDIVSAGARHSVTEHAAKSQTVNLPLNEKTDKIQASALCSRVNETDVNINTESNNAYCLSSVERSTVSGNRCHENVPGRVVASGSMVAGGDTSSKTKISRPGSDLDQMEPKKTTMITLHIKKDSDTDTRKKNKPIYSGLGLNDSSSFSMEERQDETYLSDAYSSPNLSPLNMIEIVMSYLQPNCKSNNLCLLSPMSELLGPPSFQKRAFQGPVKSSITSLSSEDKVRVEPEDVLEKTKMPNKSKASQERDQDSLQNLEQDVEEDSYPHEVLRDNKVTKKVGHDIGLEASEMRQGHSMKRNAVDISVFGLDLSKQGKMGQTDGLQKPFKLSRKEKCKEKQKYRESFEAVKETYDRSPPEASMTCAKGTNDGISPATEKGGQGIIHQEEVLDKSSNTVRIRGDVLQPIIAHDHRDGKPEAESGKEYAKESIIKSPKVARNERFFSGKTDHSPMSAMGDISKDGLQDGKSDLGKATSRKHPTEKITKDGLQMSKLSKDSLPATDKERYLQKDSSKKAFKQSGLANEKITKGFTNVTSWELEQEHVATSSECHDPGMRNFTKDLKSDKLSKKELKAAREGGRVGKLPRESGMKSMEGSVVDKNNLEKSDCGAATTEPVPAVAPLGTVIVENWVLCEKCLQWRLLLPEIDPEKLPKKFFCKMLNWLPGMNSCKFKEDETTNAVYAYLGIPNPKFAQTSALNPQPQAPSLPLATSMPAPSAPLNASVAIETPERKRATSSKVVGSKKSLGGKLPLEFSKSSSFPRKGKSGSMKSKRLNDMENDFQDCDDANEDLRVHNDYEVKPAPLKTKRKSLKTSSAEEFEGVATLKTIKIEEASNCYSLGTYPRQSEPPDDNYSPEVEGHLNDRLNFVSKSSSKLTAYGHESIRSDSPVTVPNARKHKKEIISDRGVELRKPQKTTTMEEQPSDNALHNFGGTNAENHNGKAIAGDGKVDKKLKLRLKGDEDSLKEGKRPLVDAVSNGPLQNEKKMKHIRANEWQVKGDFKESLELGPRNLGSLIEEHILTSGVQDKEQVKVSKFTERCSDVGAFREASEIGQSYMKDIGPESFLRRSSLYAPDISDEFAAKTRRQRMSSPLRSSSSQVSSPESCTRKYKFPTSPVESTVSSPLVMISKAEEVANGGKRSLQRDENHLSNESLGPTYFVTHSFSPNVQKIMKQEVDNHCDASLPERQKFQSQNCDFHLPGEIGEFRQESGTEPSNFLTASVHTSHIDVHRSWNSGHDDLSHDGQNQRGCRSSFEIEDNNDDKNSKYGMGCSLERQGAVKLKEKDGRNGQYDRHDKHERIKDKGLHGGKNFKGGVHDKSMPEMGFESWDDRATKQRKIRDSSSKVLPSRSCSDTRLDSSRPETDKAAILIGQGDEVARSDGKFSCKNAASDIRQITRLKGMEGVGKESSVRSDQEDALCTTSDKDFPDRYAQIENSLWREGKMASARQLLSSPNGCKSSLAVASSKGNKEGKVYVVKHAERPLLGSNSGNSSQVVQVKPADVPVSGAKPKNPHDLVSTIQNGETSMGGRELSRGIDEVAGSKNTGIRKVLPVSGQTLREVEIVGASGLKGQSAHQAGALIKEATDLKHTADRLKGSESCRGDLYLHAALKFLQGAAIMEGCQDGAARNSIPSLYSGTAKLCEYSANYFRKDMDMHATALTLKCAAVARMRVLRVKNPSTARALAEFRSTMQLVNPSPLGESPSSSSASDVDNLNNQSLSHDKLQATNTAKEVSSSPLQALTMSSIPASGQHNSNLFRVLQDAAEMCAAFEAWMKADAAVAALKATLSDASRRDVIKRVGEFGFSDVEVFVQLVYSALEAFNG